MQKIKVKSAYEVLSFLIANPKSRIRIKNRHMVEGIRRLVKSDEALDREIIVYGHRDLDKMNQIWIERRI